MEATISPAKRTLHNQLFKQYHRMIQARAYHYASAYNLCQEDLESEGYLIFCHAVETFNPDKATFSTHLYTQLQRLNDVCTSESKLRSKHTSIFEEEDDTEYEARIYGSSEAAELGEKLDPSIIKKDANRPEWRTVLSKLSGDPKEMVLRILSGECTPPEAKNSHRRPTFSTVSAYFRNAGWTWARIESTWAETREWWRAYYNEAYRA